MQPIRPKAPPATRKYAPKPNSPRNRLVPPPAANIGKTSPNKSVVKNTANNVLMDSKTSVQNNKKVKIPTPNGKIENTKPASLDFIPTNCRTPAPKKIIEINIIRYSIKTPRPSMVA